MLMSHYPKIGRRGRVHPASRQYDLPFESPQEAAQKSRRFGMISSSGPSRDQSETPTPPVEKDRKRSTKILLSFVSILVIISCITTLKNPPSARKAKKKAKLRRADRNATMEDIKFENIIQDVKGQHFLNGKLVDVAGNLTNFADLTVPRKPTDIPFFWHVPRSGGSTLKEITASCFGLTQASEVGAVGGHIQDEQLVAVHHLEGGRYVNVDTNSIIGLDRAISMNLASFPELDIVVSPYLQKSAELFNHEHNGRAFMLLRHPVDRAVSMYYYLKKMDEHGDILNGKSLDIYSKSDMVENNWMTRFLSNKMEGELTEEDEAAAREFLRRKCLIGLLNYKAASFDRFQRYFGWRAIGQKSEHCVDQLVNWNWMSKNKHERVSEGSNIWDNLAANNEYDIRLYRYAEKLFHEQAVLFQ